MLLLRDRARGFVDQVETALSRKLIRHPCVRATGLLVGLTALLVGFWSFFPQGSELRLASDPTLHAFIETCSIVVCMLVYVVARAAVGDRRNRNMMLLGVACLGVALLDFMHTQNYVGMPALVTPSSPGLAINFGLAARLLAGVALFAAAFLSWERMLPANRLNRWTVGMLAGVALLSWVFLYRPHWMPETFIPGRSPTPLEIWAEVAIVAINLAAAVGFCRLISHPKSQAVTRFDPVALLAAAAVGTMAALFFAIYSDINGIFDVLGHIYKVIAAWFLYRGLVANNLFEVETRAKLALESAQLGSWSWEAETDCVVWDGTAAATWGVTSGNRHGMSDVDALIHPEDRAAKQAAMQRALDPTGEGTYLADYRIVRPDGSIRYVSSRGKTLFENGRPRRVIGVVRDVTDSGQAERAVHRSEERLSGILSIAADAIISIDEKQRIIMFNQGAETIFGHSSRNVMGKPLEMLLPERFRASHPGQIGQFAGSGIAARRMGERREIYGLRKDGSEFPAEASISKLTTGGEITFTAVVRDITERKQIEEQLELRVAERTAELSTVLNAVPDGIVHADMDRCIRIPNAAMMKLFGYGYNELVGRNERHLYAADSDDQAVTAAWRSWEEGGSTAPVAVECRRKDGTVFAAIVFGSAVCDSSGQIVSRVGIIRDVTDDLKRQKALAQAQRLEAFGQLTGGIAHDFNNLLTVISGNQELLEMRLEDEKALALLKRSQAAAEMGARLTGRLLTFARRGQLEPTLLNLNEQISSMTELLRRSIGEQVTLTTNFAPRLGMVRVDPSEIENAILNLAINARDAMPNGGMITIETDEHTVESGDGADPKLSPGHYARLSVADTGTGMLPEVVSRAFEPFFTTKQPGKGTGLGLSTIHGFAQQSGGTATIYSEVGHGTTVNIYLPLVVDAGQTVKSLDARAEAPLGAGEIILLVEDNRDVRDVARRRLEGLGFEVIEAENGPAALEQLNRPGHGIRAVFSDVVMPGGMSGYDVARWVASNAPTVKVLLNSGYPGDVSGARGQSLPNVKLLRKPYSRAELARTMRQVLDN